MGVSEEDIFALLGEATHLHSEADIPLGLGWPWGSPNRRSNFAVVPRINRTSKEHLVVAPVSEEAVVPT